MTSAAHTLDREIETFNRLLPSLSSNEGRFALVADEEILGVFDTYSDAITAGYKARSLSPFLVKRISAVEVVANFSRTLRIS